MPLNKADLQDYLEISDPFLMIDIIDVINTGEYAHAIKYLSNTEWFFGCHLHSQMVMPGSLQIEAMLQTLVMTIYTLDGHKNRYSLVNTLTVKLHSRVSHGYPLGIDATLLSFKRGIAKGVAKGTVRGELVCEGEFTLISPHLLPKPKC